MNRLNLILKREQLSQKLKDIKLLEFNRENFDSYQQVLNEYRAVNSELFTFDYLKYLEELPIGHVLHDLENRTVVVCNLNTMLNKFGVRIVDKSI